MPFSARPTARLALQVLVLAGTLLSSCSAGGYWIPPRSGQPPVPVGQDQPAPTSTPEAAAPIVGAPIVDALTPTPSPTFPPSPTPTSGPSPTPRGLDKSPILYYVQAADTLPTVAVRFGVRPEEITSTDALPPTALLPPGQLLIIPRRLSNTTSSEKLLPDSELVYSPSATDFDIDEFVQEAGGKLSTYREWLKSSGTNSGADVIRRVALENSINPRLLLALLEYQSGWVYGHPPTSTLEDYPLGIMDPSKTGLYKQLVLAVNHLSVGYYGYREGRLTELSFSDGVTARLAPDLNAGTVALQYFFAQLYDSTGWLEALNPETGLPAIHARLFGDPWQRAGTVEPLYPIDLVQHPLSLPFLPGNVWAFTGGPHGAWEHDGSYAALDFAPPSIDQGCLKSDVWVTAASSGLVVRSEKGVVVLDLDGDGSELTGWVLVYLHISTEGRAPVGTWVDQGQPLGHPSCEGGQATGTHLHLARKYNGEWISADGPMPFNLSGWIAHAGPAAYQGTLTRDDQKVIACTCSNNTSFISLPEQKP